MLYRLTEVIEFESALSAISDLKRLKELFQIALQVESLSDFKSVRRESGLR